MRRELNKNRQRVTTYKSKVSGAYYDIVTDENGVEMWLYLENSPFRIRIGSANKKVSMTDLPLAYIKQLDYHAHCVLRMAIAYLEKLEERYNVLVEMYKTIGPLLECFEMYDEPQYFDSQMFKTNEGSKDESNESYFYSYIYRNGKAGEWINGGYESVSVLINFKEVNNEEDALNFFDENDIDEEHAVRILNKINSDYPIGALEHEFSRFINGEGEVFEISPYPRSRFRGEYHLEECDLIYECDYNLGKAGLVNCTCNMGSDCHECPVARKDTGKYTN